MTFRYANWNAPKNIVALSTTRLEGFSQAPYHSNNLGTHVGDNTEHVFKNRKKLSQLLNLGVEPVWLEQTHSTICVEVDADNNRNADASITRMPNKPLVILTADCLPITLCNKSGTEVAAIHAGWKGLYNGIIENTLAKMNSIANDLMAWVGPAICQQCYEVGDEVYQAFTGKYSNTCNAFIPHNSKWLANLPQMAEDILKLNGVIPVFQSNFCTFELKNEFFSYRREQQTGRIGTLIWINEQPQD